MFVTNTVERAWAAPRRQAVLPLLTIAAIYVAGVRILAGVDLPLWVDETWSAMIATQPSWRDFWREAWLDCNPPLYYLFLSAWVSVFGDSNLMLRLPSALFVLGAAAAPLLLRPREVHLTAAWTWALLLLAWQPGLFLMTDARGYGLILLLSVLSCLAMLRMLRKPELSWAFAWVGLNTLMFLTHYYAATLALGQAAVVGYRHRLALLRLWPAALAAVPGIAWLAFHYPRLQDYARPDVIWYEPLDLGEVVKLLSYTLGAGKLLSLSVLTILGVVLVRNHFHGQDRKEARGSHPSDLVLVASSGAIGFVLAMLIGASQPSLAARYLVPLVPPAMLALTLALRRSPRPEVMTAALVLAMLLPGFDQSAATRELGARSAYGFENGSEFIRTYQPDSLVFLWDHPASKILDPDSLSALGSYFLTRSGAALPSQTVIVSEAADANAILRQAAIGDRPAIIWLYNTARRSAARDHPPTFEKDASWSCHHQALSWPEKAAWSQSSEPSSVSSLGAIACVKTGKPK